MKTSWYQNKWINTCWHILAWLTVFSLPYIVRLVYDDRPNKNPDSNGFFYLSLFTGFLWIGIFYLNAFVLVPRLINKKKYIQYGVLLLVVYCITILIHGIFFNHFIKERAFIFLLSAAVNAPAFLLALAASTVFRMVKDKIQSDAIAQQKQQENLKTELSFLRSQISPHFIFNILNNLVAMARLQSQELEPTIIKLSSLMQYMLYETNEEKVLLKTEAEYLETYIDLQAQRFGIKVQINTAVHIDNDYAEIEPMLLIPFVENAFKHGVGLIDHPVIDINLQTGKEGLTLKVRNKYNSSRQEIKDKASGIGLANVQRRLDLLYGSQRTISISSHVNWQSEVKEEWFEVLLQIKLH